MWTHVSVKGSACCWLVGCPGELTSHLLTAGNRHQTPVTLNRNKWVKKRMTDRGFVQILQPWKFHCTFFIYSKVSFIPQNVIYYIRIKAVYAPERTKTAQKEQCCLCVRRNNLQSRLSNQIKNSVIWLSSELVAAVRFLSLDVWIGELQTSHTNKRFLYVHFNVAFYLSEIVLLTGDAFLLKRWINCIPRSVVLWCTRVRAVSMLRRRSQFFVFLDNALSVSAEDEGAREGEEHILTPFEEYLQMLLQMKMTSSVSQQKTVETFSFIRSSLKNGPVECLSCQRFRYRTIILWREMMKLLPFWSNS